LNIEGKDKMTASDPGRELLRHTLATLAYRGGKVLRGAPESFAGFTAGDSGRTAGQILAHMGDLMDWGLSMADGSRKWHDSTPLAWKQEVDRFFAALKAFDDYLASGKAVAAPLEKLFQGPVADALTHVGQLAMMRRMAGCAMRGENYFAAEMVVGRVGIEQAAPKREF
jgi:hypothetical protein